MAKVSLFFFLHKITTRQKIKHLRHNLLHMEGFYLFRKFYMPIFNINREIDGQKI